MVGAGVAGTLFGLAHEEGSDFMGYSRKYVGAPAILGPLVAFFANLVAAVYASALDFVTDSGAVVTYTGVWWGWAPFLGLAMFDVLLIFGNSFTWWRNRTT